MTHRDLSLFFCLMIVPMFAYPLSSEDNVMVKSDTLRPQARYAGSRPLFDLQKQLVNYFSACPQASAMMERTKCPVDHNTGAVNVSIPLHEIKTRDLTLPIVLKCKTTGIKTNEASGCVGLGWSLQAEPMITREVKGSPDERYYTTYNPDFGSIDITYLKEFYEGRRDEEPDIFYYSNLINSGQFVLRRPTNKLDPAYCPILIPAAPETFIKSNFNSGGFKMKDAKGSLYYYGDDRNYTEYTSNSKFII